MSSVEAINSRLAELFAEPLLRLERALRAPRGHRLRKPLSANRIAAFEQANDVRLPDGYKQFLAHVGDGGLGPGCGLCELSIWRTVELPANLVNVPLSDGTHQALRVVDHGGMDETVLLLSGPRAGRLVEITGGTPPQVRNELDFLEWYLSWLTVSGSNVEVGSPRAEAVLVGTVLDSSQESERAQAMYELGAVPQVADATIKLVERTALHDSSSRVRYLAIELLGELEHRSVEVFLAALQDSKRSVRRRALVHLLRLAGDSPAWTEGLEIVRSTSDPVSVKIADDLEQRRVRGRLIPRDAR